MRIKKKYILEAVEKLSTNDVKNAEKVLNAAGELKNTAKELFGEKKAKDIVGNLLAPDNKLEEVGADEVHTAKFDRCVADLEKKGGVDNSFAACQAALGKKAIKKSHQRKDKYEESEDKELLNEPKKRKVKEVIKIKDIKK